MKHDIGCERAARVDALGAKPLHGGRNDVAVLVPERTGFAGMRVEPGDRKTRPRNAEMSLKIACDDARGVDDERAVQSRCHLAQRQVNGDRHDRELGTP